VSSGTECTDAIGIALLAFRHRHILGWTVDCYLRDCLLRPDLRDKMKFLKHWIKHPMGKQQLMIKTKDAMKDVVRLYFGRDLREFQVFVLLKTPSYAHAVFSSKSKSKQWIKAMNDPLLLAAYDDLNETNILRIATSQREIIRKCSALKTMMTTTSEFAWRVIVHRVFWKKYNRCFLQHSECKAHLPKLMYNASSFGVCGDKSKAGEVFTMARTKTACNILCKTSALRVLFDMLKYTVLVAEVCPVFNSLEMFIRRCMGEENVVLVLPGSSLSEQRISAMREHYEGADVLVLSDDGVESGAGGESSGEESDEDSLHSSLDEDTGHTQANGVRVSSVRCQLSGPRGCFPDGAESSDGEMGAPEEREKPKRRRKRARLADVSDDEFEEDEDEISLPGIDSDSDSEFLDELFNRDADERREDGKKRKRSEYKADAESKATCFVVYPSEFMTEGQARELLRSVAKHPRARIVFAGKCSW